MNKICTKCSLEKDELLFSVGKNFCKMCAAIEFKEWYNSNSKKNNAKSKEWHHANPEKIKIINKEYKDANPGKVKAICKEWYDANPEKVKANSIKKYGISFICYKSMVTEQDGLCAICRHPETMRIKGKIIDLSIDHNHRCCNGIGSCGACVRQLLCSRCNAGLGKFNDDTRLLLIAANYLEIPIIARPLSKEDIYTSLLKSQENNCAICLLPESLLKNGKMQILNIDHNHKCLVQHGKSAKCGQCIRSLLCFNCNLGIGDFRDSTTIIRAAIEYLERHNGKFKK